MLIQHFQGRMSTGLYKLLMNDIRVVCYFVGRIRIVAESRRDTQRELGW